MSLLDIYTFDAKQMTGFRLRIYRTDTIQETLSISQRSTISTPARNEINDDMIETNLTDDQQFISTLDEEVGGGFVAL